MAESELADVSQFQGAVNWAAYAAGGYQAAIARLSYGTSLVDPQAAANLTGMRKCLRCRGWYHYLTAGDDPAAQARAFCNILKQLLPGEFIVVDEEEGGGNQEARAATFLATCNQILGITPARDVEYSGLYFVAAHGGWIPGVTRWVAAYQPTEPQAGQALWQHADNRAFPGIAAPCDASIFAGTVDQLIALINPPTPPTPTDPPAADPPQEDPMDKLAVVLTTGGHWFLVNFTQGWKIAMETPGDGSAFTDAAPKGLGIPFVQNKFSDQEMAVFPTKTAA